MKLFQENFIVRMGDKRAAVPLVLPKEKVSLSLTFRRNKNYAVWDERGLTIRIGKDAKSTRLEGISVSPKAFTDREEILRTVELVKAGKRTQGATALSGAKRVGNLALFLARWEDKDGLPWMEALVSVDLGDPTYHPTFLARLPGLTLANKKIDDQLFILNQRISCVVKKGEQWGIAFYDPEAMKFNFKEIGRGLESYQPLTARTGLFVERTEYGARVGGRVDLESLARKNLVEAKGTIKFVDKTSPLLAVVSRGSDSRLINTETGAELDLLGSTAMRRTPMGLVIWSPFKAPKRAWLYSLDRWAPLAEWVAE